MLQKDEKGAENYSVKLQDSNDDDLKLLTKSAKTSSSLDKKFNLELNALLNDDDDIHFIHEKTVAEGSEFGTNSLESGVVSMPAKNRRNDVASPDKRYGVSAAMKSSTASYEERQTNKPVKLANTLESPDNLSVEIPDYSPDFNSESEKIGNMLQEEKLSENNPR